MDTFTTALIGCGRIGFSLESDPLRYKPCTHYGGATSAGIRINYACDINIARLKKFCDNAAIPAENAFTNYKELLSTANPGLVIIATWTESHADIGQFAAAHGARVIVCEKPITAHLSDAENLIQICEERGVSIIINHERRYESRYRAIKDMLKANRIGEIKTVHASILTSGYRGTSKIEEGGGPLLHDGTHMIDIIRYLFGDIKTIEGEFQRIHRNRGFEDRATAWLKAESGIDIFLEAGGNRNYFIFELQVSGTRGKIVIGNGYEQLFIEKKSKLYTGFRDLNEAPFPQKRSTNCFIREYREIKRLMLGKGTGITSSGYDGYKALEVIHGIYLSAHLNKKKIELPIEPRKIDLKKIFNL
jgi:predicted dehydrogenase